MIYDQMARAKAKQQVAIEVKCTNICWSHSITSTTNKNDFCELLGKKIFDKL